MSTKKEPRKSKKNKVSDKNKPKNNPRAAIIAKIKAQAEARREAEAKELQEEKEWEELQERLEQERIVEEEIKKEKKRLKKERRDAERIERKKKKVEQAMLAKRMKIYGTDSKPRILSSDNSNNCPPVIETVETNETNETFNLRSPIICVLGHVDVGKTKLLDYLRQTHVQDNEAGGITQQIGSSFFPISKVRKTIEKVGSKRKIEFDVPGLLVIDTPGHESFVNLRSRGTSICDFAILVVDLLAGIEQQTIESINLLKLRKTPFVIALNKVDLIYGWKSKDGGSSAQNYKKQSQSVQQTFDNLTNRILVQMAEQGLNARVYWKNKNRKEMISMVPTSAHTGEGIPDLLIMITQMVQRFLSKKVLYTDNFEATILEVKPIPGLGTTIDVILVNGTLKRGDNIVLYGINGPITTTVKDILTTQPMKELRVKSPYIHHDYVRAAQGVKILAPGHDLVGAVAGSPLYIVDTIDNIADVHEAAMREYKNLASLISIDGTGVYVQSSTLGGLEALLHFLRESEVPIAGFGIGPVTKKDIIKASTMHTRGLDKYSVILAFDVTISKEMRIEAKKSHVKIFDEKIIYRLLDSFTGYMKEIEKIGQETAELYAVTPCILEILPACIFNNRNPIIVGVKIIEGELKIGTPLCVSSKSNKSGKSNKPEDMLNLGVVTKIEKNRRSFDAAQQGEEVSISIEGDNHYCYGRQFDNTRRLYSKLSRQSIDALKEFFLDTLTPDRIRLIIKIKKKLGLE